jgi:hypothetical protein
MIVTTGGLGSRRLSSILLDPDDLGLVAELGSEQP